MGKKALNAEDNMYNSARYEAVNFDSDFRSREKTAEKLRLNPTRLARIELGTLAPHPEEVAAMAVAYHSPELCNKYCAKECPIGKKTVKELEITDFDRLALKMLGSLKDIDSLRQKLIDVAEDGVIDNQEKIEFGAVLAELERISTSAQALHLWAQKHISTLGKTVSEETK